MFRRSKHLAIHVEPGEYLAAVDFYIRAFGMILEEKDDECATLKGDNFMLYVEPKTPAGIHLQEFVPDDPGEAEAQLVSMGCKLISVNGKTHSYDGFYVEDPYGLRYHVYTRPKHID